MKPVGLTSLLLVLGLIGIQANQDDELRAAKIPVATQMQHQNAKAVRGPPAASPPDVATLERTLRDDNNNQNNKPEEVQLITDVDQASLDDQSITEQSDFAAPDYEYESIDSKLEGKPEDSTTEKPVTSATKATTTTTQAPSTTESATTSVKPTTTTAKPSTSSTEATSTEKATSAATAPTISSTEKPITSTTEKTTQKVAEPTSATTKTVSITTTAKTTTSEPVPQPPPSSDELTPLEELNLLKKISTMSLFGRDPPAAFGVKNIQLNREQAQIHNLDGLNPALPPFAFSEDEQPEEGESVDVEQKTSTAPSQSASGLVQVAAAAMTSPSKNEKTSEAETTTQAPTTKTNTLKEAGYKKYKEVQFKTGQNFVPLHLFFNSPTTGIPIRKITKTPVLQSTTAVPSKPEPSDFAESSHEVTRDTAKSTGTVTPASGAAFVSKSVPQETAVRVNSAVGEKVRNTDTRQKVEVFEQKSLKSVDSTTNVRTDDFLVAMVDRKEIESSSSVPPPAEEDVLAGSVIEMLSTRIDLLLKEMDNTTRTTKTAKRSKNPDSMILPTLLAMPSLNDLRSFGSLRAQVHPKGVSQQVVEVSPVEGAAATKEDLQNRSKSSGKMGHRRLKKVRKTKKKISVELAARALAAKQARSIQAPLEENSERKPIARVFIRPRFIKKIQNVPTATATNLQPTQAVQNQNQNLQPALKFGPPTPSPPVPQFQPVPTFNFPGQVPQPQVQPQVQLPQFQQRPLPLQQVQSVPPSPAFQPTLPPPQPVQFLGIDGRWYQYQPQPFRPMTPLFPPAPVGFAQPQTPGLVNQQRQQQPQPFPQPQHQTQFAQQTPNLQPQAVLQAQPRQQFPQQAPVQQPQPLGQIQQPARTMSPPVQPLVVTVTSSPIQAPPTSGSRQNIVRATDTAAAEESFARAVLATDNRPLAFVRESLVKIKEQNRERRRRSKKHGNKKARARGEKTLLAVETVKETNIASKSPHDGAVSAPHRKADAASSAPTDGTIAVDHDRSRGTIDRDT